ncbi:MAG TPA: FtsW/RodA/SpoVE family cell cycle protein [Bacillales bacterium]|nr:FtsW/RodA/SpoVE family cell cycle protein [Bacillales bacterium]
MLKKMFRHYDYTLVVPVLLLCGFGVLMVYSASMELSLLEKQVINLACALIAFFAAMLFPYKAYQKFMKPILVVSLLSLVVVLLIGKDNNGAESWIKVAGFNFQPSEFVKLGLIIYLAAIFSKKQHYISNFSRGVLPPLIVILITFVLIVIQPDLGTAMIVAGIAGVMIFCSGMRVRHLTGLLVLAAVGISLLLLFGSLLSPEQLSRFSGSYEPFEHADTSGYQLINSYIAIASGGLTGRGLGESLQKYDFLYAAHTDFIMAVIAEEFGLFGVLFVIGLLAYLVFRGFLVGIRCKDTFGSLLAIGIAGMLGIQSVVNLGVVCGLVPTTGVPLPFISYGGSALVLFMFSMGVLINISMFVNWRKEKSEGNEKEIPTNQTFKTRSGEL